MRYFPAFLDLEGRSCLVVGGGETAQRKIRLLRKAGARVTVVAPKAEAEIHDLAAEGAIVWQARAFTSADLAGQAVVHSATGLDAIDTTVAKQARAAGLPVNVVDRPDLSSFIMPAIVDRDPLVIGISSGGTAPVLARRLRERLESLLPAGLGRLARFAESFRAAAQANIAEPAARRRFWESFFDGPIAETVLDGDERRAREQMLTLVNSPAARRAPKGLVHIVGAGPGDPDLLTFRAMRVIQQADVVFYDNLVGPEILDYVRRDAERVYVGKSKGNHAKSQTEINALIAKAAQTGQRVVRLKGGDPFIFGRGGEELAYLKARGIETEVVPGITAATGCAAAAGIPLTHRGLSQAVTFATGHAADGEPDLDWAALADPRQTLVVYMGVSTAGVIARRLIEQGAEPSRPVAVIENGTRPDQKVVSGTIAGLEDLVRDNGIKGPALIVVGEVAAFAETEALPTPALAVNA